jgi:ribonuclease HI
MIKREPSSKAEPASSGDLVENVRQGEVPVPPFVRRTKAEAVLLRHPDATPKTDEIVIYTNGQIAKVEKHIWPVCAIVFETNDHSRKPQPVAFSMEPKGPTGMNGSPKALRAALRAVVGALELKIWSADGFKQVTIATDNADIFYRLTDRIEDWHTEGALETTSNIKLNNRDLWIRALDLLNEQTYRGCEVKLWLINGKQNKQAFKLARAIKPSERASVDYRPCGDVGFTFKEAL